MSRATIDTNILRIREVTAINPQSSQFIQPGEIPVISYEGKLKWFSSLEFLSSISVPGVSCSVLTILSSVQPGISSLAKVQTSTFQGNLCSTVAGLGESSYISTSGLQRGLARLSYDYRYVSATTLYDCISHLGRLDFIGGNLGSMSLLASNFTGGYVSTVNPGEYRIYKSTIMTTTDNLMSQTMQNGTKLTSAVIDIGGFSKHIVNTSKLTIDIFTNMSLTFDGGLTSLGYFSTYLTTFNTEIQIGESTRIKMVSGQKDVHLANIRLILTSNHLFTGGIYRSNLQVTHFQTNGDMMAGSLTTNIPQTNGVFVTLDNTD